MSTPLLTHVAGELAMPRLRPLELVSRAVGREWSLLPPNASFRAELKALYAAMMRTVCMSASAIRAMSRWDSQAKLHTPSAASPSASAIPEFKADTISLGMRDPVLASARKNRQSNMLAGGACAIGGAALIAWLMANHPRHPSSPTLAAAPEVTLNSVARLNDSTRHADAPIAWNRAHGDLAARDAEHPAVTSHASVASKRPTESGIDQTAKRERDTLAKIDVRHAPHATQRPNEITPHRSVAASRVSPDSHIASIKRPRHLPSIAGAYSPVAPSARFDSDYGSVTMSAGTHISDIPPAVIRRERVDTDSTEWMNHMSHRRITEAPDSFSK